MTIPEAITASTAPSSAKHSDQIVNNWKSNDF